MKIDPKTRAWPPEPNVFVAHAHIADTFSHKASSGLRHSINPLGPAARVHWHLNIGQDEVPWDDFYRTLAEVVFEEGHDCLGLRL